MNYFKTSLLLAALTALFMGAGFLLSGEAGMVIAFIFALGTNAFAYWNSDKMVLRMYGAREVDETTAPDFVRLVRLLANNANLPMPRTYIMETDQPNAFATGRNPEHGAVAITTGLLKCLNREETAGVIAHELAHIANRDTLTMTVTATFAGAISMLANFASFSMLFGNSDNRNNPLGIVGVLLTIVIAPLAAMLVQMAISRSREYEADARGAEICGKPEWLASALKTMERSSGSQDLDAAESNPATAHMFILNPLHSHTHTRDSLFSTHPATKNRIARLLNLSRTSHNAPGKGPWDTSGR